MRKIGYRVKPQSQYLKDFIAKYVLYFDTMEIKIHDDMLHTSCVEHIIHSSYDAGIMNLSFHIPKKALYDKEHFDNTITFLNKFSPFSNNVLVTHFYPNMENDNMYIEEIISRIKPEKVILTIENVEVFEDLMTYLTCMKEFASHWNLMICLDIGHLMYSAIQCNISLQNVVRYFSEDLWWKEHVVEIHMHETNELSCHLNIGCGIIDYSIICQLFKYFNDSCPIILETTIEDLSVQGVSEVQKLREEIGDNADN